MRSRYPDVHEILRREVYARDEPVTRLATSGTPRAPPEVGVSDQYVVLDSFVKGRESRTARGEFHWDFMVQGVTSPGMIGMRDRAETIVEIQVGEFALPVLPEVPYVLRDAGAAAPAGLVLVHNNDHGADGAPLLATAQYPAVGPGTGAAPYSPWTNNPYTQLPFGGRLTAELREVGLQSFSDRGGARHHFEFTVVAEGAIHGANPMMASARPVWDTYVFTDPLRDVHGLTLQFRNPDVPVVFEPDVLYDAVVDVDAAGAPGPYVRVTYAGHGLLTGDRVFVWDLATGNGVLDTYLNRAEGHVVANDPAAPALAPGTPTTDPDAFYLDPAVGTALLSGLVLPAYCSVGVAKRRLRVPLRMRRVIDRLTNYKMP